ncbi:hypothetical protein DCCM_4183 [Desulfocucumis palustris]|uniref:HTH-type transcriptional regulator n=1 Tax=Desulfocucumis palustris TaxID=1898651 RepID=A0A2L2XFY2_9FIRM|nr:hypothetical protein [Desulfocucumis palustris]GBF35060.1 hypothetical protein DCCM_4183 [Desulfocucumis palustris]
MTPINSQELDFVEEMGILWESSGATRTLGRVFGYLLLSEKPKSLDQLAKDLIFSKATASLTIRQGLMISIFEKVSIPGKRKDYYRVNINSWIDAMNQRMKILLTWETLIEKGLHSLSPGKVEAAENLRAMKDYFEFMRWYMSDFPEKLGKWRAGEIDVKSLKQG